MSVFYWLTPIIFISSSLLFESLSIKKYLPPFPSFLPSIIDLSDRSSTEKLAPLSIFIVGREEMKFKIRKLKIEDHGETQSIVSLSIPAEFIIYAPPLQSSTTTTGSRSRSQKQQQQQQPSPGFESSMALTIFILLTALFFMGFFSVYLRCVDSGRRRRSRRAENFISNTRLQQLAAAAAVAAASSFSDNNNNNPSKDDDQGLDPIIIRSLPILPYNCTSINNGGGGGGGCGRLELEDGRIIEGNINGKNSDDRVVVLVDEDEDEEEDDCVVCLCEYEEGEMVKVIPNCGHMFHPECIDLWFISHSSCPLCRSTQLFPPSTDQKKQEEEDDDELMKSTVVMMRRAYSFSGGFSSDYSSSSSSSSLGGDNIERFVTMLKRSSSWS